MSNPTGPQDPYGQQGDGSSWTPGQDGGSSAAPGYPGGDMGSGYSAPPPPPGYYGGSSNAPMFAGTEKNNLGVWALVLGILGLVGCGIFAAIPALVLGNKSKQAAAQGLANNGGLGQAGVVLGIIGIVLFILAIIFVFALGGLAAITESTTGTTNF